MPPSTTNTTTATIEEEHFPPAFLASLDTLPPGSGRKFIRYCVATLREELYGIQQHRSNRKSSGDDNKNEPHQALLLAMSKKPAYVTGEKNPLKFLRCENYDAEAAAQSLALYFQEKQHLFPPEALTRDIVMEDLSDDDMDAMHRVYLQILKKRDHIGRPVLFYYKALTHCYKQREKLGVQCPSVCMF